MYVRYRDRVTFLVVYIKEAHPSDAWLTPDNWHAGIHVKDPRSQAEREEVAQTCAIRLNITLPVLVDTPDNEVARQYGAWPDRLYLIDRHGRVAYQAEQGPFGFKPEQLEAAIQQELARETAG